MIDSIAERGDQLPQKTSIAVGLIVAAWFTEVEDRCKIYATSRLRHRLKDWDRRDKWLLDDVWTHSTFAEHR